MNTQVLQDPDKYFWLVSGKPIRSLLELFDKLKELTDEEFDHHLNEKKNDFHQWINDVFGEHKLAEMVKACTHRDEFRAKVNAYLLDEKRKELTGEDVAGKDVAGKDVAREELTGEQTKPTQEHVKPKTPEDASTIPESQTLTESQTPIDSSTPEKIIADDERGDALQRKVEMLRHEADEAEEEIIKTPSGLPDNISRLDAAEEREKELREYLRLRRKIGEDTFMPDLILRRLRPRMKLARLTGEEKEADLLEGILDHAEEEMRDLLTTHKINVKKEVSELAYVQEEHLPQHKPEVIQLLKKINGETEEEASVESESKIDSESKKRVET